MSMELGPYTNFHELNLDWFLNEFNTVLAEWAAMNKSFSDLNAAFNDLHDYVHDYFKNLDVQEEIDNKLDSMARDGSLYAIIRKYTDPIVNEQNDKINVLKARMDTFASLPDGSTTGDAELTDIRVGYNGTTYPSAGDAVREQVSLLHEDINDVKTITNSLGHLTPGGYIDSADGEIKNNNGWYYSGYISINEKFVVENVSIICYYDENKMYHQTGPVTTYNEPTEITNPDPNRFKYMRCSVDTNQYETNKSGVYLCDINSFNNSPRFNGESMRKNVILNAQNNRFINLLSVWKGNGYFDTNTGDVIENREYVYSFPILVNGYNKLITKNTVFACFYNQDGSFNSSPTPKQYREFEEINIPSTAYSVRICAQSKDEYISELYLCKLNEYNTFSSSKKIITAGEGYEFKTLKSAIEYGVKYTGTIVHCYGVFDLISEFGEEYFNTLGNDNEKAGLLLYNDIQLIFDAKSVVYCNYNGNNDNVKKYFSPFNSSHETYGGTGGFKLIGLNLIAKNVRYGVHDEHVNDPIYYKNRYINCSMTIDNSQNTAWQAKQCIGGGLGLNGDILIENCVFESVGIDDSTRGIVTYHNSKSANAKSRIKIANNYFKGIGTVRASWYGESTEKTDFMIYGNSLGSELIKTAETNDGTSNIENIEVISWNNEIRN